jgi:taurine dioxygenase
MSALNIVAISDDFGARITDCDVRTDINAATFSALAHALYANRVIVIRAQQLSESDYSRFGEMWGEPIPHVLDHMRMRGYPQLMTVGNTEPRDRDPLIRNGAALWHTDQSYERVPASATMLYSIIAPAHGGETQFCDMRGAYDALDKGTRAHIDTLKVAHKYGAGKRRLDEPAVNPIINDEQDRRVPTIYHPLAYAHPITGTRALYALGHGAHGIQDMEDDDAEALLGELKAHCAQERFIYRHKYDVGDLVIWDTLQTMHRATPIEIPNSNDDSRLLWRISVRGIPSELWGTGQS